MLGMKKKSIDLSGYELELLKNGEYSIICGVDEAGRGPLAGDVYAAAVILDPQNPIEGLNDSKKLTAKKREFLFDQICEKAIDFTIGTATVAEIDEINILKATFLAMKRAVEQLHIKPDLVLVDGNADPNLGIPTKTLVGGDGISASIAAASIVAKVSRDRYMESCNHEYPDFHFSTHKGYGTKLHYEVLHERGPTPLHRRSFLKNLDKK